MFKVSCCYSVLLFKYQPISQKTLLMSISDETFNSKSTLVVYLGNFNHTYQANSVYQLKSVEFCLSVNSANSVYQLKL